MEKLENKTIAQQQYRGSDYSPIQWLDMIMEALVTRTIDGKIHMNEGITINLLFESIQHNHKKVSLENIEFTGAIDKLIDDKFIKLKVPYAKEEIISISFLGLLHIQKGGYSKQQQDKEREFNRNDEIQANQRVLSDYMFVLTVVLALGALIAAIYYLFQLYDGEHLKPHPCESLITGFVCVLIIISLLILRPIHKKQ